MTELVEYLRNKGHSVKFDENPSPEKVARIKAMVKMMRNKYN